VATDWYPGAHRREISKSVRSRPSKNYPDALIFHVAVSESSSLYGFFSRVPNCSHFYLRRDGTYEQYLPISSKSSAEKEGNARTISVETQGGILNPNSEPWADAQLEALSELAAWCFEEHGIRLSFMESSKPQEKGIGTHRLGCNGNFPSLPDIRAGRIQRGGGELWTNSRGKICPGDAKVRQVPGIISRAIELAGRDVEVDNSKHSHPSKPSKSKIDVDGFWGRATTHSLQTYFKTPNDGVVSNQVATRASQNPGLTSGWDWDWSPQGSILIMSIQERLGFKGRDVDGLLGPDTINALSSHYGIRGDGRLDAKSITIKAMQKALNAGKF